MIKGRELLTCLACGGSNLETILDLGDQPLANSFIKDPTLPEDKFPLELNVCRNCWHCQLSYAVNPDLMFKDYLYVSGTSKTLKDYMDWFANFAYETYNITSRMIPRNFLDIACNDGTQLDAAKKLGFETYGIDPAENLYPLSSKNHIVALDYLSHKTYFNDVKFDVINAQNVFAHNTDPVGFMEQCKNMLATDGLLFIQNSQADMIKNGEFDTMYHEHVSFWNANSIVTVAERVGLMLVDRIRVPVHGISDLFIFKKFDFPSGRYRVNNILEMEKYEGLHDMKIYRMFGEKAYDAIAKFEILMDDHHKFYPDNLFVGFGAAAKGMTFLNACKGDITGLDYIVDENPLKQGLYTPGTHIPVVGSEILQTNNKIVVIPLAWNFRNEIFKKIGEARPDRYGDKYIIHLPKSDCGDL